MALKKSSGPKESSAIQHLYQRRIALLGLGVENRALAHFLHTRQIPFAVCDARDPATPVEGVQQWRIGECYLDDLTDFDLLFRTPGLPTLDPRLRAALRCGVEVSSQTRLFLQLCPVPVLGVTGTKGKGTTTALLHALLATDPAARVFSGGNIGRPPLEFIDELQPTDRVVLELSSFQLQDLDQSPHIAVVLSVTEDHSTITPTAPNTSMLKSPCAATKHPMISLLSIGIAPRLEPLLTRVQPPIGPLAQPPRAFRARGLPTASCGPAAPGRSPKPFVRWLTFLCGANTIGATLLRP